MSEPIISVENLGKKYRLTHRGDRPRYVALRDVLAEKAARLFRRRPAAAEARSPFARKGASTEDFWALRDVSFEIRRGEVVGIIGRNGAGKSTLLKVLSRITEPSAGRVLLRGRVASLLEVGTGFHPELTGRENVFLNGAILGMTREEIRRKFDEIVAFAEVEKFLDTPVKRYSSGMYVRLAFAVAAHLEPEILIVDEVLAVGDAQFQKKCLGKMQAVSSHEGRTVLFVSHNMVAVQSLCSRAILLDQGGLVSDSAVEPAIAGYLQSFHDSDAQQSWATPEGAPGNAVLRIKRVQTLPQAGAADEPLTMERAFRIETEFWSLDSARSVHLCYHLLNDQGITVLTTYTAPRTYAAGTYRATCHVPGGLLNSGGYFLKLLLVEGGNQILSVHESLAAFQVVDAGKRGGGWMGREPGVVQPVLEWNCIRLEA